MNSFVLNSRHIEALKADINVRNSYINELESKVDQQQFQLKLLAEAVLEEHGYKERYDFSEKQLVEEPCDCEAGQLAREIAEVGNDQ